MTTPQEGPTPPDWDRIRRNRFSPHAPPEWRTGLKAISMEGLTLVGVDTRTGELYWDGDQLVTAKKIRLGRSEWWFALVTSVSAGGIFVIELVKAVAAILPHVGVGG